MKVWGPRFGEAGACTVTEEVVEVHGSSGKPATPKLSVLPGLFLPPTQACVMPYTGIGFMSTLRLLAANGRPELHA